MIPPYLIISSSGILRASLFNYKQFVCEALFCKRDLILGHWSLRHTQFGSVKAIEYIAGAIIFDKQLSSAVGDFGGL